MAITTGEDTWDKWGKIINDLAPGFLKNRKRKTDKEVKKATPKKKKK